MDTRKAELRSRDVHVAVILLRVKDTALCVSQPKQ